MAVSVTAENKKWMLCSECGCRTTWDNLGPVSDDVYGKYRLRCQECGRITEERSGVVGVLPSGIMAPVVAPGGDGHGDHPDGGHKRTTTPRREEPPLEREWVVAPEEPMQVMTAADLVQILGVVEWAWEPWLPKGMVTLVAGEVGIGKSALALALAGIVLQGTLWPDGQSNSYQRDKVVLCDTEAAWQMQFARMMAWGLPMDRILVVGSEADDWGPRLDTDMGWAALEAKARQPGVGMIIVDSLSGGCGLDENKTVAGQIIKRLSALATELHVPCPVIHHLRKKQQWEGGELTLDKIRGSTAIPQMARVVWGIDCPDKYFSELLRVSQLKNNLALRAEPVGFKITDTGVVWTDAPEEPRTLGKEEQALGLLQDVLKVGPVPTTAVIARAVEAGISEAALKRARARLHVVAVRRSDGWCMSLPSYQQELPTGAG